MILEEKDGVNYIRPPAKLGIANHIFTHLALHDHHVIYRKMLKYPTFLSNFYFIFLKKIKK
jgi:hypothetical protein